MPPLGYIPHFDYNIKFKKINQNYIIDKNFISDAILLIATVCAILYTKIGGWVVKPHHIRKEKLL